MFPYKGDAHPMLNGIDLDWLRRWNSVPGMISDGWVGGEAIEAGNKILWQENPDKPVVTAFPLGEGEMLVSLLHLKQRITRGAESYDPAAEHVLVNMLAAAE